MAHPSRRRLMFGMRWYPDTRWTVARDDRGVWLWALGFYGWWR